MKPTEVHPDRELVQRSLSGEPGAIRELGERMEAIGRILIALNVRRGSPLGFEEVSDLAQEVSLLVWRRRDRFLGRAALETWMYGFCRMELRKALDRRVRKGDLEAQAIDHLGRVRESAIQEDLEVGQPGRGSGGSGELQTWTRHLSDREQEVTLLRHLEQLDFREIASRLGISASSVKTHYYRGLDKLRQVVHPEPRNT